MSDKRKGWLDSILPKNQKEEAEVIMDELPELKNILDQLGVQRKELGGEELAQALVADILAAVDNDLTKLTPENLAGLIAASLANMAEREAASDDTPPPVEDETKEDVSAKEYGETIQKMLKDQGDIALMQGELLQAFKQVVPLVAQNKQDLDALQAIVRQRPKQASKDRATSDIMKDILAPEQNEKLRANMEKALTPAHDPFWDTGKNGRK